MKCEVCEGEVKLWSGKPRCWSCGHTSEVYDVILNEEREKQVKEFKVEEEILPNYDKPFCWACREHSRYRGRLEGEGYDLVRVCVTCNSKMYKPSDMDYVGRNWEKSCIFFAIIITVSALYFSSKIHDALSIFIICLSLFFICRVIWKWDRHDIWVKWAKARGWQVNELPPSTAESSASNPPRESP